MEAGNTQSFMCVPIGRPLPKVVWYKDDKVLQPTDSILLSADNYKYVKISMLSQQQ